MSLFINISQTDNKQQQQRKLASWWKCVFNVITYLYQLLYHTHSKPKPNRNQTLTVGSNSTHKATEKSHFSFSISNPNTSAFIMPAAKQSKKRPRSKESPNPSSAALPSAGYLLNCDAPTKQYIKSLNETKTNDKKFIIEDLDPTHLLVRERAREEIFRKVEEWMDKVRSVLFCSVLCYFCSRTGDTDLIALCIHSFCVWLSMHHV